MAETMTHEEVMAHLGVTGQRVHQLVKQEKIERVTKGTKDAPATYKKKGVEEYAAGRDESKRTNAKGPRRGKPTARARGRAHVLKAGEGEGTWPLFDLAYDLLRALRMIGRPASVEAQASLWYLVCGGPPAKDEDFVLWLLHQTGVTLNEGGRS